MGAASTSRRTKLNRTPRTPASSSSRSSASLTSGRTVATPRARPAGRSTASTIARLSAPWHVACTMTLRLTPEVVAQGEELVLARVAGVYLRSGAKGNSSPGPNTWQCASTAPAGSANVGVDGSDPSPATPRLGGVELIVRTVGENNPVRNILLKIVNNLGGEP